MHPFLRSGPASSVDTNFAYAARVILCVFLLAPDCLDANDFESEAATLRHANSPDLSGLALVDAAIRALLNAPRFSAAVDVETVDRLEVKPVAVRAKEAWSFWNDTGTNYFVRRRFAPQPGLETITSTNHAGARLTIGSKSTALPDNVSLPGFELLSLLREMSGGHPVVTSRMAGRQEVVAAGGVAELRAWFNSDQTLPSRLEKRVASQLSLVLTRVEAVPASVLPAQSALHFYENGRVVTTVLRSFTTTTSLPPQTTSSSNSAPSFIP